MSVFDRDITVDPFFVAPVSNMKTLTGQGSVLEKVYGHTARTAHAKCSTSRGSFVSVV